MSESLDEIRKWFNWQKNAKICPRCKQRITSLPCSECGFKHKTSMTKPKNLKVQTEGDLEEVKKILPMIAAQVASGIAGAVLGGDDEEEEQKNKASPMASVGFPPQVFGSDNKDKKLKKALEFFEEITKRGGQNIGNTLTGKPTRMTQANTKVDPLQRRQELTIPSNNKRGFNPAGRGLSGDVVRGHTTSPWSAKPAKPKSHATPYAANAKQQFGNINAYQPKNSPLHHTQSNTPAARSGAFTTDESSRKIPSGHESSGDSGTPHTTLPKGHVSPPKPKQSVAQRVRGFFKKSENIEKVLIGRPEKINDGDPFPVKQRKLHQRAVDQHNIHQLVNELATMTSHSTHGRGVSDDYIRADYPNPYEKEEPNYNRKIRRQLKSLDELQKSTELLKFSLKRTPRKVPPTPSVGAPKDIKESLGEVTDQQRKDATNYHQKDPFHKGGAPPIEHTKTGKVKQHTKPVKWTASSPFPQKRVSRRSGKNPTIFRRKDGTAYGDLWLTNVESDTAVKDDDTFVGKPAGKPKHETYIEEKHEEKQHE